jgi:threonine synthase
MIKYISTKGGISPVGFDEAILQGFAEDGGLFVPEIIPTITAKQLQQWSTLNYTSLAYEILSLFIDPQIIPSEKLKELIAESFSGFEHPDLMPLISPGENPHFHIMELFHGPTLSFKDIAMGFLVRTMDYLLKKRNQHLNLILATTGDTGPAAANASAGRKTVDCWPLFPAGMISAQQEQQMTTLKENNIHPIAVNYCLDGGDDLDIVVTKMFSDNKRKQEFRLSSVNSINWCRVMVQTVHYAYGYFRACKNVEDPVVFSVPSGAFGNLCAGDFARKMGIPISTFICANNQNQTLHTAFSTGLFKKRDLIETVSSAIDIVVPYNFWRFLFFNTNSDSAKISAMMKTFQDQGEVQLDPETYEGVRNGFKSVAISDEATLSTIKDTFEKYNYLLDPHGAVAVAAAKILHQDLDKDVPVVCLATAHPAKFPAITRKALGNQNELPQQAVHHTLESAKSLPEKKLTCDLENLEFYLSQKIKESLNS